MFSSRKLQISIPSVKSQASEPADDNNQEDEYRLADDSIIDADLEVSNTSGDKQEAEVMGAAQKDPPAGPSMKPFKKPNIQMKRKILKSDAINRLLSLEKRKSKQFEKVHENKRDMWRTWERWRLSFPYESIASSSWCLQMEEACYQYTFTSSDGRR